MIASEAIRANSADTISVSSGTPELGRQDFLTMLIAQLENQDPLNPQEGTEFTAQLAQFSSLEQLLGVRESIDSLAAVQTQAQTLGAVGLIGKNVLIGTREFEIGNDPANVPTLSYELSEPSEIQSIDLIADTGAIAARISNIGTAPAGITKLDWNDFDVQPGPGSYTIRINQLGEGAIAQPLVETRVTGTALQDGVLYLGNAQANLSDVREVRQ